MRAQQMPQPVTNPARVLVFLLVVVTVLTGPRTRMLAVMPVPARESHNASMPGAGRCGISTTTRCWQVRPVRRGQFPMVIPAAAALDDAIGPGPSLARFGG
jgi:hypothetical protein